MILSGDLTYALIRAGGQLAWVLLLSGAERLLPPGTIQTRSDYFGGVLTLEGVVPGSLSRWDAGGRVPLLRARHARFGPVVLKGHFTHQQVKRLYKLGTPTPEQLLAMHADAEQISRAAAQCSAPVIPYLRGQIGALMGEANAAYGELHWKAPQQHVSITAEVRSPATLSALTGLPEGGWQDLTPVESAALWRRRGRLDALDHEWGMPDRHPESELDVPTLTSGGQWIGAAHAFDYEWLPRIGLLKRERRDPPDLEARGLLGSADPAAQAALQGWRDVEAWVPRWERELGLPVSVQRPPHRP